LADRSGLSRSYLCDIERGRGAQPSVATLDKLANALGASRTDLLRVAGILEPSSRLSDERERRFLSVFRDLGTGAQDAVERFARFLHAEEHRWVQPRLLDGEDVTTDSTMPIPTGPTLFDRLDD
jgi:transcriptional regulator with XRE-family HTH domain